MRAFTLATFAMLLATLAISPANAAGTTVVTGIVSVPDGQAVNTSKQVYVVGSKGMILTDVCAGILNGSWVFSGNTVGDFMLARSDFPCTTVNGIALPANEVISCTNLFNAVSFGDAFCTVSGLE